MCTGSGNKPGTKSKSCPECGGKGTITFGQGGFAVSRPCPNCLGRGQIPTDPCTNCNGTGQVTEQRQIALNVPAGVDNGSKLRLAGQGEKGQTGQPAGDLIITFKVQPHSFFRRDGLDVHTTIPLNLAQALLGSRVRVKTVDGRKVTLKIPPGTQSGTEHVRRARGVPGLRGGRGDLVVHIVVETPTRLDGRQEELLRELAAIRGEEQPSGQVTASQKSVFGRLRDAFNSH